jgi:hypothetical protein
MIFRKKREKEIGYEGRAGDKLSMIDEETFESKCKCSRLGPSLPFTQCIAIRKSLCRLIFDGERPNSMTYNPVAALIVTHSSQTARKWILEGARIHCAISAPLQHVRYQCRLGSPSVVSRLGSGVFLVPPFFSILFLLRTYLGNINTMMFLLPTYRTYFMSSNH